MMMQVVATVTDAQGTAGPAQTCRCFAVAQENEVCALLSLKENKLFLLCMFSHLIQKRTTITATLEVAKMEPKQADGQDRFTVFHREIIFLGSAN